MNHRRESGDSKASLPASIFNRSFVAVGETNNGYAHDGWNEWFNFCFYHFSRLYHPDGQN